MFIKIFSDIPDYPHHLRIISISEDSVTIEWSAPTSTGGTPVTGYVIEKRESHQHHWSHVTTTSALTTSFKIQYLQPSMSYYFRVAAENEEGVGIFKELGEAVRPMRPKSKYQLISFLVLLMTTIVNHAQERCKLNPTRNNFCRGFWRPEAEENPCKNQSKWDITYLYLSLPWFLTWFSNLLGNSYFYNVFQTLYFWCCCYCCSSTVLESGAL